jgi:hypothetical protein
VKTTPPVAGVLVGQTIRLDAKISGSPPIDVKWYRDGEEVQPDMHHKIVNENDVSSLLILQAAANDRGVYDCVAANVAGEACYRTLVDVTATGEYQRPSMPAQTVPSQIQEPLQQMIAAEAQSAHPQTTVTKSYRIREGKRI